MNEDHTKLSLTYEREGLGFPLVSVVVVISSKGDPNRKHQVDST